MPRSAAALAALLAIACSAEITPPATGPPNLLLIVSDTLRADALSCYGGAAATPNICGLAERGVLFERSYSAAAATLPSSVTMFTGKHASGYARAPKKRAERPEPAPRYFYVHDDEELLAERLLERGYDVVFKLENALAKRANNLQGFRRLSQPDNVARVAARLGVESDDERYLKVLAASRYLLRGGQPPFFLLLWIVDPHAGYTPPDHLMERIDRKAIPRLPKPLERYTRYNAMQLRKLSTQFTAAEVEVLRTLYLKEVEFVDERVGTVLKALDAGGLTEQTLVFFTSDHGEGFNEHGQILHGAPLYDEKVHVPLIAAGPGLARGLRVREPVGHADLVPTLAELLGVETPEDVQGRSLASLLRGEEAAPGHGLYIADARRYYPEDALVRGSYKLISRSGALELYDLVADPAESRSLVEERPEVVEGMLARLEELRAENDELRRQNLTFDDAEVLEGVSDATEEELRAMGYIE